MHKIKRSILITFTAFLTFVLILVTLFFITPFISIATYHVFASGNSNIELDNDNIKYNVTQDISYESKYENGFFDYYEPLSNEVNLPTIIWVYSLSYFKGDKEDLSQYIPSYVNEGFNVAVLNFERNFNTKFPTAIKQIIEAYQYLINNKEALLIDSNNIFVIGSNTGAIIASQFLTASYVSKYREAISIEEFDVDIKATLLFYGLEDIKPFNQVVEISQLLYQRINWAYYNKRNWLSSERYIFNYDITNLGNIYITETNSYEYIKEGNKLSQQSINYEYYNPDNESSTNVAYNYYMYLNDDGILGEKANINFNRSIEFMKKIINN